MFDRARSYDLSKANLATHQPIKKNELNSFNQNNNSHINYGFNRSPDDDQELNNMDNRSPTSRQKKGSITSLPPFKHRSSLRRKLSQNEVNFERGETIFFERKSIIPELETVIKWSHLDYEITAKGKTKKILDDVSGEVNNLEIMAILGPSGAGKSTLLNTIAGKIKNYSGSVNFYSKDKRITFAYVPQVDQLSPYLTVKESLLFSSRLKNPPGTKHIEEVEFVLSAFNLWKAKNHYSFRCSGGERKRLSIGLEMISKPKILILDEPTSGLDSTTSYIVIEVLKNINKNTAIITTIHQPNSNLFQLFDKCYILTAGKCIYEGTPSDMVDHLKDKFQSVCPTFTNPADFILEVANDIKTEKGIELIDRLAAYESRKNSLSLVAKLDINSNRNQVNIDMKNENKESRVFIDPISNRPTELLEIHRSSFKRKNNFFTEFYENFKKLSVSALRDPQQTVFRFVNSVAFPIVIYAVTSRQLDESGCSFLPMNSTHILPEDIYERYDRQLKGVQGAGIAFINLMFMFFSSMIPAILVLSQHINVLKKEHLNSYYTVNSFFSSIVFVNFLLGFFYSTANALSFFYFTGQEWEHKKFLLFWLTMFLSASLGDFFGLSLSIIYPHDNLVAVVLGGFGAFAIHTLSGFFVPVDTMRSYVQSLSWVVFCRHTFEATMRIFYGHGKCKVGDEMIFDFDNLIEFVKYYNHQNGNGLQNIDDMPLKVRNALREKVWNKAAILEMAETMNDLNETEVVKLNDFWDTKTSYLLDSFGCQEDLLAENILMIFATIVFFILLCYCLLLYKLKK